MTSLKALANKAITEFEIVNEGEELEVRTKQYDPETGEATEPKVERYLKSTLEQNLAEAKEEVERLELLLKEFKTK
jgi:hypothetical protein